MRRWLFRFLLSLLVVGGIGAWWLRNELDTPYLEGENPKVFVELPRGANSERIARLLEEAGVLHDRIPFMIYLRWTGMGRRLKAGEYLFDSPATPPQVAAKLERGDVFYYAITIPEGLTAQETVAQIAESGLSTLTELEQALSRTEWIQDLDSDARSLEGYLFPETYRVSRHAAADQILKMMVDRFREVFRGLQQKHPVPYGWSIHKVIILASIIEKEVKSDAERDLVASVLSNRLRIGMPLACDPTIIYALKLAGKYDGNIRKPDLQTSSPYNTYINPGLPPGPISNPGEDSLRAALAPADTDYLYFVARNDGTHEFSTDLKTHERAVYRFQKTPSRK